MGTRDDDVAEVVKQLAELAELNPEAYDLVLRHLDEYLEEARERCGVSPIMRRSHRTT